MNSTAGFTFIGLLVAGSTALILLAIGRLADRHEIPDPPKLYDPEEERPCRWKKYVYATAVAAFLLFAIFVATHLQ